MKKMILAVLAVAALAGCDQTITRQFGGTTNVSIPEGTMFVGITWKENDLWVTYFDPKSGKCYFKEQSRVGVLEGQVIISNCNPVGIQK